MWLNSIDSHWESRNSRQNNEKINGHMNLMTNLIAVMLNINTCQQTQGKSLLPWTSQTSYFLVSHCGHILHQECSHLHKIKKFFCQETEEQFEHSFNGKNQGLVSQMNKHHSLTASSSKHAHRAILCTVTYLWSCREITTTTIKENTTVRAGVTHVCFPCMGLDLRELYLRCNFISFCSQALDFLVGFCFKSLHIWAWISTRLRKETRNTLTSTQWFGGHGNKRSLHHVPWKSRDTASNMNILCLS